MPAGFAAALILFWQWPYLVGLGAGMLIALTLGLVVEMAIIRRFRDAPRMVMIVATLGVTQLLVVLGILVPRWWGKNLASQRLESPLDWKLTLSPSLPPWKADSSKFILGGNDIIAMVVAPLALLAVAWFLNRSRLGVAIRAAAERGDRAAMLGIPVARLNTVVWMLAAALSFLALFLRSGITGVPLGFAEGLPTLLIALAALVIGRLEHLAIIATAAVALKLLEFGVQNNADTPYLAYPIMAGAMFVALLAQRGSSSRRDNDATSSWRGAEQVRPLPAHLASNPWVSALKYTVLAVAVMVVLLLPNLLGVGNVIKASALLAFAVIGLSLVVLTGWAGQVSLGQMAIVGIGAAVSATVTIAPNPALFFAVMQYMGPTVSAETFRDSLFASAGTRPGISQPFLSYGDKGYWGGVPDYQGVDDATVFWWDPNAVGADEIRKEGNGMYQYVDGGERYLPGEWTTTEKLFDPAGAVSLYATPPPGEERGDYPSPAG